MTVIDLFGDGIGKVELKCEFGSDLTVVNAARVSFGKGSNFAKPESVYELKDILNAHGMYTSGQASTYYHKVGKAFLEKYPRDTYNEEYLEYFLQQCLYPDNVLKPADFKLINYLAAHKHDSPFRHAQLQFALKVPESLARQHWKHIVGCAYSGDGWNEISMRYTEMPNEFYVPDEVRGQSKNNKQCSAEVLENSDLLRASILKANEAAYEVYKSLLKQGVARETARGVLPLNTYTSYYWTTSLQAICNFIKLRRSSGAQGEIRELAESLHQLIKPLFPCSVEALLGSN